MIRLTEKDRHIRFIGFKQRNAGEQKIADIYEKLGKLEDIMEKYEINSIEALEELIIDYDDMAKDIVEMGLGVKVEIK